MPTQNYYRILGTGAAATAREIEQGYLCQCTRLRRLAADPAMRARLVEVEAGYEGHSGPRARAAAEVRWHYHARLARSLNAALLACCWASTGHCPEYPHETVQSRFLVSVSAALSAPELAHRGHTARISFRLPSAIGYRVRPGQALTVWQTPRLGIVQRISAPESSDGPAPF